MAHFLAAASLGFAGLVAYYLVNSIYVLFFHPLAGYPGPKLWLITRIPNARALRSGQLMHRIRGFHQQYGPVVRWAPNELSFISPDAWRDIYGHHGPGKDFARNPLWYPRAANGAHNILSADNTTHARIRKLVAQGFSEKALREQERFIQCYVSLLVTKLQAAAAARRPINIGDYLQYATVDIAGDLIFGEPFDCVAKEEAHQWVKVTFGFFRRLLGGASLLMVAPYLRPLLPYLVPKRVQEQARQRFAFSCAKAAKRLALGEAPDRNDLITYICRYNNSPNEAKGSMTMSRAEIEATVDILISAGSETTATALTGTIQYLLRNPHTLAKLQAEVRGSLRSADEAMSIAHTTTLPYLSAVLQEGLRMCPPAPSIRPRLVPAGGALISGGFVPAGTSVGIPPWTAFRSAANFGKPDDFIPERWLPATPEGGGVAIHPHEVQAFQPFSYGPRDCLGRRLGWAELRVLLATLVWHFDWENRSPDARWEEQVAFVMWEKQPLFLELKKVQT
ncbi:monooxygenase [Aspergillus uvarum CBS 121591]|uniref:Monooxygenase n=1 Tax=Aspergillus uvarum CBS 121591 TaxID=1448315 RepID=A0A319C2K7_9EURO|nr:monooxygenase [Aspergillus uvarum CBS 121591]PYH78029.1 monooxygenase [Aspergillus uvarum CBS 121591]